MTMSDDDRHDVYRELAEEARDTLRELRLLIEDLRTLLDAEIKQRDASRR
jgi:hypothetical protein